MVLRQILRAEYTNPAKSGAWFSNSAFQMFHEWWHFVDPPYVDPDLKEIWGNIRDNDEVREYFFGFSLDDWDYFCERISDETDEDGEVAALTKLKEGGAELLLLVILPGLHAVFEGHEQVIYLHTQVRYWR